MSERLVVGWREWVRLPDLLGDEAVKVKVDTGARTSAVHAWDLERFVRDDVSWVRFNLHPHQHDDEHVVAAEAVLVDEREVRSSNGETETRLVVETTLSIGALRTTIELTLTNRDEMGFRMLLGRTAMAGLILVDPGRSYLAGGNKTVPPGPAAADTGADR